MGVHKCTSVKRDQPIYPQTALELELVLKWQVEAIVLYITSLELQSVFWCRSMQVTRYGQEQRMLSPGKLSQLLIRLIGLIGWTLSQYSLPVDLMANLSHIYSSEAYYLIYQKLQTSYMTFLNLPVENIYMVEVQQASMYVETLSVMHKSNNYFAIYISSTFFFRYSCPRFDTQSLPLFCKRFTWNRLLPGSEIPTILY